jgi:hypothetical protein
MRLSLPSDRPQHGGGELRLAPVSSHRSGCARQSLVSPGAAQRPSSPDGIPCGDRNNPQRRVLWAAASRARLPSAMRPHSDVASEWNSTHRAGKCPNCSTSRRNGAQRRHQEAQDGTLVVGSQQRVTHCRYRLHVIRKCVTPRATHSAMSDTPDADVDGCKVAPASSAER